MKYKLLLIVLFAVPFQLFSQLVNYKNKYRDQLEPNSKFLSASYNNTVEKTQDKNIVIKYYYPETKQITHFISKKKMFSKFRHGKYMEWYDDGTLFISGQYNEGIKTGKWIENKSEGNYKEGQRDGEWIRKNDSGDISARFNYIQGKLEGEYIRYDSTGTVSLREVYLDNKLIETSANTDSLMEADSTREVFKIVEEFPSFPGCEEIKNSDYQTYKKCAERKLLEYVYATIKYPKIARKNEVTGTAKISFVINKQGDIEDIKVLRGLCEDIKNECVSMVENMPQWHPGTQNGKPVNVIFNLPIKFNMD